MTIGAQVSSDLVPGSRAELAVEKLVGFGLIDDRVYGLRPWSKGEVRRLLDQARANLDRLEGDDRLAAERVIDGVPSGALDRRFGADLLGALTAMDSPWLVVPDGQGRIDADLNHLARYRGGRDVLDGETASVELAAEAALGDRFAIQGTPRLWVGRDANEQRFEGHQLLDAQLRAKFGGVLVDVGRLRSVWGPGRDAGTLLAGNARGLDGVRVSSDAPFSWPGFMSNVSS